MSGILCKAGLISFAAQFPAPAPNVIPFQYNPATMQHGWSPATAALAPGSNPLALAGQPREQFSFTLEMDANDSIADGDPASADLASASGLYSRLAALELLLFPAPPAASALVGSVSAGLAAGPGPTQSVPNSQLPTVLFVWGPGRILPVRVQALTITETLYDTARLNPLQARAHITLTVLNQDELSAIAASRLGALASTAYGYTQTLRQALALANLANGSAPLGMLA